jgi:hypothetical protein
MTFFYDLNKRMAELANKQTLAEGKNAKPDFLDMDKDGDKKEPMKKALKDKELGEANYSAKKAAAGKDIGKPGKAFAQIAKDAAGRYGSKEKGEKVAGAVLKKLRAKEDVNEDDVEEGNEFSGALAKAKAAGASEFEVDGKKYQVTSEGFKEMDAYLEKKKKEAGTGKFDKKQISTGTVYTRKHEEEDEDDEASDAPKKKGRKTVGAGKGKKIGAKVKGTSKLSRKGSIAEMDDSIPLVDKGEFDREGEMAKQQIHTIMRAAKNLHNMLGDDDNLPEWVQKKITLAQNYIDGVADYLTSQRAEAGEEAIAEKAVSQAQRKAAGIAYAAAKGDIPKSELRGASKEMAKMPAGELKKFAKTKEKGLPEKVKETEVKAKGGIEFGKGIYESINSQVEKMIVEGMSINVSMNVDENGKPTKTINVNAEGEQAETLAQLLNLAGMSAKQSGCGCGQTPCGCDQVDEAYGDTTPTENAPDYPTDAETTGDDDELLRRWAGGLNKPKSTGQTTIPVIASQTARQVSEENKADKLGMNLYAELQSFKAK